MIALAFLALVAVYALADRFAGGGAPKLDAVLPGRAAFWGATLAGIVGCVVLHLTGHDAYAGSALALIWFAWRTLPWKLFGGSMTPVSLREIAGTWVRHLIPCALALVACIWLPLEPWKVAGAFMAFAIVATGLAVWLGEVVLHARKAGGQYGSVTGASAADRCNPVVEMLRGAAFGLATAWVVL